MEYESKDRMIIIRFGELYQMLLSRIWMIVMAVMIGGGAGGLYSQMSNPVPMYRATTKMYVTGMESTVPTTAGFSLGKQVISNYIEIIKSRPVLEQIIQEMELNMNYQQLRNCISYRTPDNTSMLELSVEFPEPQWAKAVVDRLAELSADKAELIIGSSHPRIYEEAYLPAVPYNLTTIHPIRYIAIGSLAAVAVLVFLLLLVYFVRNRFETPDQVEESMGMPLLTMLPKSECSYKEEALKSFYSRLYYYGSEKQVYSFVSIPPRSEKTGKVMLELAGYLCGLGKRVICIDGNMFCPEWGFSTGIKDYGKGLKEYLSGQADLRDVIWNQCENAGTVDCIGSGSPAINSLELLGTGFWEMLKTLEKEYDYIFLDLPPGGTVPDTKTIAAGASDIIWLISSPQTPVRAAGKFWKELKDCGQVNAVGAVLYDVDWKRNRGYLLKAHGEFWGLYQKKGKKNDR